MNTTRTIFASLVELEAVPAKKTKKKKSLAFAS
jgi:hypothetical protein